MVILVLAEVALAGHVLHGGRFHVVVGEHAGDAAAEQRHVAGQAQRQVDVGTAAGDAPGAVDARGVVAADFGVGDIGGTATDVDDHGLVPFAAFGVIVHGRRGGSSRKSIWSKPAWLAASRRMSSAWSLPAAPIELRNCTGRPSRGRSQRLAELGAGGQADVLEDVRGDAGDGLLGAWVQVVAEHRFRALHRLPSCSSK